MNTTSQTYRLAEEIGWPNKKGRLLGPYHVQPQNKVVILRNIFIDRGPSSRPYGGNQASVEGGYTGSDKLRAGLAWRGDTQDDSATGQDAYS